LDPIKLKSFDDLERIPHEILKEGVNAIAQYILKVSKEFKGPKAPIKVAFIGKAGAGKTSLADALIPLKDPFTFSQGLRLRKTRLWFSLQGPFLHQYNSESFEKEYILSGERWSVTPQERGRLLLQPREKGEEGSIELGAATEAQKEQWASRLARLLSPYPSPRPFWLLSPLLFSSFSPLLPPDGVPLSLFGLSSVTPHLALCKRFLSSCTLLVFVFDLRELGHGSHHPLRSWLRAIQTKIPPLSQRSIFLVGTHLDLVPSSSLECEQRKLKTLTLVEEFGLKTAHLEYLEVSTQTLENILGLQEKIARVIIEDPSLNSGFPIPAAAMRSVVKRLREENKEFPVVTFQHLLQQCQEHTSLNFSEESGREALDLLESFGECLWINSSFEASKALVVLSPTFLSLGLVKKIEQFSDQNKLGGILPTGSLSRLWSSPEVKKRDIVLLLESFKIGFLVSSSAEQGGEAAVSLSEKGYCVILHLLPIDPPADIEHFWSEVDPRESQEEKYSEASLELASPLDLDVLLFSLHQLLHTRMIWRRGGIFQSRGESCHVLALFSQSQGNPDFYTAKLRLKGRILEELDRVSSAILGLIDEVRIKERE